MRIKKLGFLFKSESLVFLYISVCVLCCNEYEYSLHSNCRLILENRDLCCIMTIVTNLCLSDWVV